ncbi:MAG TPA: hypothetical protein PKE34_04000, partial [Marmoricola sp.]|nr:hypothetical protein [Marmoricola sp.]
SGTLSEQALGRVESLQVVVRDETPFLPKVAFTLITLASLGGATFTGLGMGLDWIQIAVKWLTLWSLALAGGFLTWRVCYLRAQETDADQAEVDALNASALSRADLVGRWVAPIVLFGAAGALVVPQLSAQPALRGVLVAGSLLVATSLAIGVSRKHLAISGLVVVASLLLGWAYVDAGANWPAMVRLLHLSAFTLWLGGALWNIAVAMPAGRQHPVVDAVLAGANQLDRFRWVVRFALPTIIATGLVMAWGYHGLPVSWWVTFPGVLIPLKVLAIIALVVVFITCPLFRHCSPVQGVCNLDDLDDQSS